jgi:RNA polymerase sigma-70 factor (ECF subfamily)
MALSEEASRIVTSAREDYSPARADKARNQKALALRIAVGTSAVSSVATGSVLSSAASKVVLIGLAATTAVGAGAVTYEWTNHRTMQVESPPAVQRSVARGSPSANLAAPEAPPTPNVVDTTSNPPATPTVVLSARPPRVASPPASGDRKPDVEAELALLRDARSALSAGDSRRALELTEAHARAFPHGVLAEERRATRIVALCSLGRFTEGRREAQAFVARAPDSPLAERVHTACAGSEHPR